MSAPVRVVFVVPDLAVGGAERHLVDLVAALDPARVAASVVCLGQPGALFADVVAAGVPARALERRKRAVAPTLLELMRHLRRERPDAVVVRGYSAEAIGRVAALLLRVPAVLVWVHNGSDAGPRGRVRRWTDRLLIPRSTAVLGFVEAQRPYLRALGWRDEQVRLVPPGVVHRPATHPPARVRAELGLAATDEVVVTVARIAPPKDHPTLLRAFRLLVDARPHARLLVVGDGGGRASAEKLAAELGIADRTVFAGARGDVADLLAASDVAVLASRTECAPVALLEAMDAGLPVVASAVGGVGELVDDGVTGHLVPPRDAAALAERMAAVLGSPSHRAALGAAGRARVGARFRHDAAVRHTEEVLTAPHEPLRLNRAHRVDPVDRTDPGTEPAMRLDRAHRVDPVDRTDPGTEPAMRLDIVVDLVDRGGAETQLLTLVRSFHPDAVRPRLICLRRPGELADDFRAAGCPVVILERPGRLARLTRLLRGADVMLVPNHHRAALTLGRLAALAARTPSVVAVHDMGLGGRRALPRDVVATLAASRALVAVAPRQVEHLRTEGVGGRPWSRTRVHVVPNGVPTPSAPAAARAGLGLGDDDVVIGMIGRLAPEKDHPTALAALARLGPGVRLLVVGGGPREGALRALAAGLGVADRVVFTGSRTDVPALLGALDVFCLSSRDEAAPLAVLEAMAAGLPVVCTAAGALPDLVADGVEGFVVPVGDPETLAARLGLLVADPGLRRRLGDAARSRARRDHSAEAMARGYEAVLHAAIGRKH